MAFTVSTEDGKTFYVSRDFIRAITGTLAGKQYRVSLHALPRFVFHVEADSIDAAQSIVVAVVRKERALASTSATVQSL